MDILNFEGGELFPEIGYTGNSTGTITALYAASTQYQLDLSAVTGIQGVKEVYLVDSDSNKIPYNSWIWNQDSLILELDPNTSKPKTMAIASYTSYYVVYFTTLPTFTKTDATISLNTAKLSLFKKICLKEALGRILNDHAKLDRYRTQVGRMNEYALMAMRRDLTTEIELSKRKLVDTHPTRSF